MVRKLLILTILWGAMIFLLSSIPGNSLPKSPSIPHFDKIIHAGLYFVISSLIMPLIYLSKKKLISSLAPIIALFIVAFYGGLIEIAQENWFKNRSGDIIDFLADITGSVIAIAFYYIIKNKYFKPHKPHKPHKPL